jgi:hypothetical protein
MLAFKPPRAEHSDYPCAVMTSELTLGIFLIVSIALTTLSNSTRILLLTALLSDRISDFDVYRAEPRLALESQVRLQLLRGDEGPGYVALQSKGLARAGHYFSKRFSFGIQCAPCHHT